jgi:zinc transport system ATP-binding protein
MNQEVNRQDKVVELTNVYFSYGKVPVLENVNLTVSDEDFLSIVGPNAGGKTTLLKLMMGLLSPQNGTVRLFGDRPDKTRFRIGYMPQNAELDFAFPVTVMDVVMMGLLGKKTKQGLSKRFEKTRAREMLDLLEIGSVHNRPFSALSGGQRQRVLIARALAVDPELLILDEPTSNVDAAIGRELFEILSELNKRIPVIVVTHDIGFVSYYVKNVACVNRKVAVHPTSGITGEIISEIYGTEVRMVRHDETGHGRDSSL